MDPNLTKLKKLEYLLHQFFPKCLQVLRFHFYLIDLCSKKMHEVNPSKQKSSTFILFKKKNIHYEDAVQSNEYNVQNIWEIFRREVSSITIFFSKYFFF